MLRVDIPTFALSVLGSVGGAAAFIAIWSFRAGSKLAALEARITALEGGRDAASQVMAERLKSDRERQEERWREMKEDLADIRALSRRP